MTQSEIVGQDTSVKDVVPSIFVTDHAPAPPVGFVDVATSPEWSIAMHSATEGHETSLRPEAAGMSALRVQSLAVPEGVVDVSTRPKLSTATHCVIVGQEVPVIAFRMATVSEVHAATPPLGLVAENALPNSSTITQSDAVGHEMSFVKKGLRFATVHAAAPPVGLDVVTTFPLPSIAAQSDTDGHDTSNMVSVLEGVESTSAAVQAPAPPVGLVVVTTSPKVTATHSATDAHEMS
jgi:hypothetical protein